MEPDVYSGLVGFREGWVQKNKMYTQGRLGTGEHDVYSGWVGFREHKMYTQGRLGSGNTGCIFRVGWAQGTQDVYSG